MRFGVLIGFGLALCLAFSGTEEAQAQSGSWTVALNKEQTEKVQEVLAMRTSTAMAISPDGAWGWSWGARNMEDEKARALGYCREHLRPKKRDCFLYLLNGKIVAPKVVETRIVSMVYKPVDGRAAPKVLGRAKVDFQGNKAAAFADFETLEGDPSYFKRLRRDRRLEAVLKRNSFMNNKKNGFAIWFDTVGGQQYSGAKGKILKLKFSDWRATSDGLVCMTGNVWNTGKQIADRCLIIEHIKDGVAQFFWSGLKVKYQGQIIAGNALYGAVR